MRRTNRFHDNAAPQANAATERLGIGLPATGAPGPGARARVPVVPPSVVLVAHASRGLLLLLRRHHPAANSAFVHAADPEDLAVFAHLYGPKVQLVVVLDDEPRRGLSYRRALEKFGPDVAIVCIMTRRSKRPELASGRVLETVAVGAQAARLARWIPTGVGVKVNVPRATVYTNTTEAEAIFTRPHRSALLVLSDQGEDGNALAERFLASTPGASAVVLRGASVERLTSLGLEGLVSRMAAELVEEVDFSEKVQEAG